MNVLLLGSGAREHALCRALSTSSLLKRLWISPGNYGTRHLATHVALPPSDGRAIAGWARENGIDLVVIGPEAPIAAAVADYLNAAGVAVFAPTAAAARLETSKCFAKELALRAGIPTAPFAVFTSFASAEAHIRKQGRPLVVKADGLAGGKGVIVPRNVPETIHACGKMLGGFFGHAGERILLEDILVGEEISFFALVDGTRAIPFGAARDYKRALDGDQGPNTGGMGAASAPWLLARSQQDGIMDRIIRPALHALDHMGHPWRGPLYAGLMLCDDGPRLIEFNARLGDPETQALLPRLETDLLTLYLSGCRGGLESCTATFSGQASVAVALAARGYPGQAVASLIRALPADSGDAYLFHANTGPAFPGAAGAGEGRGAGDGAIQAPAGRALTAVGLGRDFAAARRAAYDLAGGVVWDEGQYRTDIAADLPPAEEWPGSGQGPTPAPSDHGQPV